MKIKKELIGWSIGKRHYRYRSKITAIFFYGIDFPGNILFYLRKKTPPQNVRNIAVLQFDHLGDTLLTGYFMSNLRTLYPWAKLTLLTREMNKPIAELLPHIDKIKYLNTPWLSRGKRFGFFTFSFFILTRIFRYDLVFDLHGEPRNILLARILGKFTIGFGIRGLGFLLNKNVLWRREFSRHIIEIQYDLLRALGHSITHKSIQLNLPSTVPQTMNAILNKNYLTPAKYTLIQMSSGKRIKEWPLEKWIDLIQSLLPQTYVITADLDDKKTTVLKERISNPRLVFLKLSLPEYLYLISQSNNVVSVDTFTIHAADMFTIPVTGLYSGTNLAAEWGPGSGHNHQVLQDTSCQHYPCGFSTCVYGYPSRCMQQLQWHSGIDRR